MSMAYPGITHCADCGARIDVNTGHTCNCLSKKKIFYKEDIINTTTITNGDHIRQMDDRELAYFLTNEVPYNLFFMCRNQLGVEKWLKENRVQSKKNNSIIVETYKYDFGDLVETEDGKGVIVKRYQKTNLTDLATNNRYGVFLKEQLGIREYNELEIAPLIEGDEE